MESASPVITEPVLLALGSNIGDRLGYLKSAMCAIIERNYLVEVSCSPIYESAPVGYHNQPDFLNCCITGKTSLQPDQLYCKLKELELELGRQHRPRWHEREIDIDIILYGSRILQSVHLEIPHPRALERAFVLIPAQVIASDWIVPTSGRTIAEHAAQLPDNHTLRMYADPPLI
jgi:2-amino-4-hydroxy-6-hydroxymethyldihydropteridine diphosphokinase